MPDAVPFDIVLGRREATHLRLEVLGFVHPEVAEPHGFDLLACRVRAHAEPVNATFAFSLRVMELVELRSYLAEINSGNGPPAAFTMSG